MGLEEDFQAYMDTKAQSNDFALEQAFRQHMAEQAAGGTMTQAPSARLPIGSTVGSIAGGIAGARLGGVPGAVVVAGAGGIVGDLVQTGIEHLMGVQDTPQTPMDALKSAGKEGAIGALSEGGGRAVIGLGAKALAPFAKTVTPEAQQAITFLQPKMKQPLLPSEATSSRTLDVIENVAESSLIGGGAIKSFKENRAQVFEDMADDIVNSFGPKTRPDEIGQALMDAVAKGKKTAQAPAKILYNTVEAQVAPTKSMVTVMEDSPSGLLGANGKIMQVPVQKEIEVGGANVSTQSMKLLTKPLAKIASEINRIEGGTAGDDLVSSIQDMKSTIPFAAAKALRSRLIASADKMSIDNKGAPAIGVTRRLVKVLNGEMEKSLGATDPNALAMWRHANTIYREGEQTFNNRLIRGLVKKGMEEFGDNPEAIAKTIFQPGKITSISRIKEAVDSGTWKQLQSFAVQDLLAKGSLDGVITGKKLDAAMFSRTGYGPNMMGAVFDPGQVDRLKAFSNALRLTQEKQSEGTGRMLIQLAQGGAAINLIAGATGFADTDFNAESGVILLGPAVLAQLLTHAPTANWLIRGVQMPAHAAQAGAIAGHLLSAAFPRPLATQSATRPFEPRRGQMLGIQPTPMQ